MAKPPPAAKPVDPRMKVEFVLDEKGAPRKIKDGDLTHYEVKVSIEHAPADAYGVTYRLHSSYFDPVREVHDASDAFAESFTTYGDYRLNARVRTDSGSCTLRENVADALSRTYSDDSVSAPIAAALNSIRTR